MKNTLYKIEDKTIIALSILEEQELQLDNETNEVAKDEFYKVVEEIGELVNLILEHK